MHHSSKAYSDDLSDDELAARANWIQAMTKRTCHLLSKHSFKTEAWWKKGPQEGGEVWMAAEDMLTNGIIDEIIINPPIPRLKRPKKKKVTNANKDQQRQSTRAKTPAVHKK
jgi:ATP-dependent protease ClpP protease subunit